MRIAAPLHWVNVSVITELTVFSMIQPLTVYSPLPDTIEDPLIRHSESMLSPSGRAGLVVQFTNPFTPLSMFTASTAVMNEYESLS